MRPVARIVAVVALGAALLAPPAAAHGGATLISATDGGYAITVEAAPSETRDGRSAVDVTTYLVRRDNGAQDMRANVALTIDTGSQTLHVPTKVVGDGYEAIIPADRQAWRAWAVTAHVRGGAGQATAHADPTGAPDSHAPSWLIPVSVVLIAAALAFVVVVRRRRRDVAV